MKDILSFSARKGKVFMCLFLTFVACSAICEVRTSGGELLFLPPVNFVLSTLLIAAKHYAMDFATFVIILWWFSTFQIIT